MKRHDWSKDKVKEAVKKNKCYSDVLRSLNIPIQGNNMLTLKKKIKDYCIDISHFDFTSNLKKIATTRSIEFYLTKNSKIKTAKLKEKLYSAGLKENKCEICGCDNWLGKKIVCQLHHIDGDNSNNELSNLQILCPNCHSQTDNYCGNANTSVDKHYCIDCGRLLKSKKSKYCTSCAGKHRRICNWELEIDKIKSYLQDGQTNDQIGKQYGVSEATIRKCRKKFNI